MDHQDIRTLKFLEEIEKNNSPSQRQIANQLNISLGLANSFVKRLVQKGHLKITTIPKNRVKYILTPKGVAEKTRLTYEFIRFSFRFYKDTRQKLKRLFSDFSKEGAQSIAFYGAGELAEIAYISLQETDIYLTTIFDESLSESKFFDRVVESAENLPFFEFDKILITIYGNIETARLQLTRSGIPLKKIAFIE